MSFLIDLFSDPLARLVTGGVVLIAAASALIGCFLFLKKSSLVGDAIAHAALPGVCLAFALFQTRHPAVLLLGAMFTGWLSMQFIDWITSKTHLKSDSAIGIALSCFFGIGIFMLTAIQHSGAANQSGLDHFLFGNAAGMMRRDVLTFSVFSVVLLIAAAVLYRPWKWMLFDRNHAEAKGLKVWWLEQALSLLTVLAVALGIQTVGVVLMAALLITPAAAARFWTHSLQWMLVLAMAFGVVSGVLGAGISYAYPRMPTGPWMVLVVSVLGMISFAVGKEKGLAPRWIKHLRIQRKIANENVLKLLYQLGESAGDFHQPHTHDEMINRRTFRLPHLARTLRRLDRHDLVKRMDHAYVLTSEGIHEGGRITRLHRLWEIYLNEYLRIAPDHVHDDAEAMEHIITPELEAELLRLLDHPKTDPHDSAIPYPNPNN